MRKITVTILSILCLIFLCVGLSGCKWIAGLGKKPDPKPEPKPDPKPDVSDVIPLINGGFESADL